MAAAATTKAFMTVGAGFVDMLRLGDVVEEGSLKGVGEDALRVVAIFPVGKAASMLTSHVGQKYRERLLISVEGVAKALKMPTDMPWKIPDLATGMSYLPRIGAKVGPVVRVETAP